MLRNSVGGMSAQATDLGGFVPKRDEAKVLCSLDFALAFLRLARVAL